MINPPPVSAPPLIFILQFAEAFHTGYLDAGTVSQKEEECTDDGNTRMDPYDDEDVGDLPEQTGGFTDEPDDDEERFQA